MPAAFSVGSVLGTADAGATTQDSGSIAVASGSVMYVLVESSDTTAVVVSGVRWDPTGANQALTQIGTTIDHSSPNAKASLWRLINPTAATAVVRVTWGSNQSERLVAVWVGTGIDTTTPNGTLTQTTGTTTAVSTGAITTTVGQLVLSMATLLSGSGTQLSFNTPNGTERNEGSTTATPFDTAATQDISASGTSTTMTWTISATPNSWAQFGIPLNDAPAGGGNLSFDEGVWQPLEMQTNPLTVSLW